MSVSDTLSAFICIDFIIINLHLQTVRTFLPGMIKRKRGHIVAVSSITTIVTVANCVTYSTTKAGNDNFMSSLFDDLFWQGHGDYIKLTTAYPGPIGTQKNFQNAFKELSGMPMHEPSYCGQATVEAIVSNRRKLFVPRYLFLMKIFK
jgi:all-trans-retinol dehydrogenase (NAD+)